LLSSVEIGHRYQKFIDGIVSLAPDGEYYFADAIEFVVLKSV